MLNFRFLHPIYHHSVLDWCVTLVMLGLLLLLLGKLILPSPPRIATVDVTGIVREFMHSHRHSSTAKATEEQVQAFGHQLEATLKTIAKERHVVLLPQEAVITGAMDLTEVVKKRLVVDLPAAPSKGLW